MTASTPSTSTPNDSSASAPSRVVLVTGGTRGIGRGIAEAFLAAGDRVWVCGRKEPDELPAVGPSQATFVSCNVRDAEDVERMVSAIVERDGQLDVLINNAGGAPYKLAAEASARFSASIIDLNLTSALHCSTAANAVMQRQPQGGAIVNIASVSALRPSPGTAAYGAAKAGLLNLTTSLAVEWAPRVRVNAVSAGLIETELSHLHYGDDEGIARVAATVPLGRMGRPGDVAACCIFLASAGAAYVSGANIVLHGGGERPAFLEASTAG